MPDTSAPSSSRVLMLYGDDESEPRYANEFPREVSDDSSWREISNDEDENHISAISQRDAIDDARDPECLTVASPGLRTVGPGTTSLLVSDDAMSIATEPRACVCAPSGQAQDPSCVPMLYDDNTSSNESISAISPSPRAVAPVLARAEIAPHEVVYDWTRGRFVNYEADEVSEVSEVSTASEAAQVCEVTEVSDSESHVSPVHVDRHWDYSCPHPDTLHSTSPPIRRLHQGKHGTYATETHVRPG